MYRAVGDLLLGGCLGLVLFAVLLVIGAAFIIFTGV